MGRNLDRPWPRLRRDVRTLSGAGPKGTVIWEDRRTPLSGVRAELGLDYGFGSSVTGAAVKVAPRQTSASDLILVISSRWQP